mgnify:CR=1 FL=1
MAWNRPTNAVGKEPQAPGRGRSRFAYGTIGVLALAVLATVAISQRGSHGEKGEKCAAGMPYRVTVGLSVVAPSGNGADASPRTQSAIDAMGHGFPSAGELQTQGQAVTPPSLPPPMFSNSTDQIIALLPIGDGSSFVPPPPIGKDFEAEFLKSLKTPIVIGDGDDERTRELKRRVIDIRTQLKGMIDRGIPVAQVIREHQELANENAKIRSEAMSELRQLVEAGDTEAAREYKFKINIALGQMGIAPMTIPVTDEERAERAAARRERMLIKRAEQAQVAERAQSLQNQN